MVPQCFQHIVRLWNCFPPQTTVEKAMAPHSSTLAWKIPWTEEPGGLQSMGSRIIGHDWATSLSHFTFMHWRRNRQCTPVFLPGESQGWGSLVGCHLWGHTVRHDCSDLAATSAVRQLTSVTLLWSLKLNLYYVFDFLDHLLSDCGARFITSHYTMSTMPLWVFDGSSILLTIARHPVFLSIGKFSKHQLKKISQSAFLPAS